MNFILAWIFVLTSVSKAGLQSVQVSSDDKLVRPTWLFDIAPPNANYAIKEFKKGTLSADLAAIKLAQAKSNFKECWQTAVKVAAKSKEIEPWVVLVGLQCGVEVLRTDKSFGSQVAKEVGRPQAHNEWLYQGPYASGLRAQTIDALLALVEIDIKDKRKKTWNLLDQLFRYLPHMSSEQKAAYFAVLGDITFVEQKWSASLEYYKKSVSLQASVDIQKKIDKLKSEMNNGGPAPESNGVVIFPGAIKPETELDKIETRMAASQKTGNLGSVVEDAGEILQKYPETKSAETAAQKLLEIMNLVSDETEGKYQALREKVISAMESCQPDRMVKWAKYLSSRGQYSYANQFATKALKKLDGVVNTIELYELTALTADHAGKTEDAIRINQKITEKFPGTVVAREANFRLGIENYRIKEYSQALKYLETYLSLGAGNENGNSGSNGGFRELNALYWKVRTLEKLGRKEIAEVAAVDLMNRYPVSYYGILLRNEKFPGRFQFSFASENPIKGEFWLVGEHQKAWRRLQTLISSGWLDEAQLELKSLPMPTNVEMRLAMLKFFTATMDYPAAIKWITEAWDLEERFRQRSLLMLTYPRDYESSVDTFAMKNKLEVDLVLSLIRQESAFSARAVSRSGALGLMQLIPMTAEEVAKDLSFKSLKVPDEVFNPKLNIQMGTHYLAKMLRKYNGTVPLALASYNAGPTRLDRWLGSKGLLKELAEKKNWTPDDDIWFDELPWSETSYYVKAILRNLIVYRSLKTEQPINLAFPFWKSTE